MPRDILADFRIATFVLASFTASSCSSLSACAAEYAGQLLLYHSGKQRIRRLRGSEINHNVSLHITLRQGSEYRITVLLLCIDIHTGYQLDTRIFRNQIRDHLTHRAVAAMHNCSNHLYVLHIYLL